MADAASEQDTCTQAEWTIWDEVQAERERAHAKHGDTSMEALEGTDLVRLTVLLEEVGEVAREFNEWRHTGLLQAGDLRKELIQVAAMAGAWADKLGRCWHCDQGFDAPPCVTIHGTGEKIHYAYGEGLLPPAPNDRTEAQP